jgi:riboflavin kinase/FMN adenylyltransferase
MANVGTRPTIHDNAPTSIEVHVFDASGDWYEKPLTLRWMHWMRGEVKFDSKKALVAALEADRTKALNLLASSPKPGMA